MFSYEYFCSEKDGENNKWDIVGCMCVFDFFWVFFELFKSELFLGGWLEY